MTIQHSMHKLAIFKQVDSWFFRESRPHGSFGANALSSVFPPPMRTLIGAIRAHIGNHYFQKNTDYSWNDLDRLDDLTDVIGNSDHLGSIRPRGVFLLEDSEAYQTMTTKGSTVYYPSPINICHKSEKNEQGIEAASYFALQISDSPSLTDVGLIRLPKLPEKVEGIDDLKGAKPLEKAWMSKSGWEYVLNAEANKLYTDIKHVRQNADFMSNEYRLGIQVNNAHRSVVEGQLYQTSHIRLKPNVSILMPLEVDENELAKVVDNNFLESPSLIRLGGEGRMAYLNVVDTDKTDLPKAPRELLTVTPNGRKQCVLYLITKLKMSKDSWLPDGFEQTDAGWKGNIRGLAVNIVSGCVGKAQREGGWDQKQHKPRPIENYIPAGSALYLELDADITNEEVIATLHGKSFFENDEWGEGLMLVGKVTL